LNESNAKPTIDGSKRSEATFTPVSQSKFDGQEVWAIWPDVDIKISDSFCNEHPFKFGILMGKL
jgi:hypothetical protein